MADPNNEPGKTYDVTDERREAALRACEGLPTEWIGRGFVQALYRAVALMALADRLGERAAGKISFPEGWWDACVRSEIDAMNNIADPKRVN